jgi:hypothetical protein
LLAAQNAALRSGYSFDVLGLSFGRFRQTVANEIHEAANAYAREIGVAPAPSDSGPVVATGHQPEFVHAGVWIKNFVASRIATAVCGSSVNVIVDNDVPRHMGLVLPAAGDGLARRVEAELAARRGQRAYEEYLPQIDAAAFAAEVSRLAAGQPFEEGARDLARRVASAAGAGRSLADVIAAVRVRSERELGVINSEVPVSRVADSPSFGAFALSVMRDAERFREAHNRALAEYRREHGIRSVANPLPDLGVDGDSIEAPFWVWRRGEERGRLYVRRDGPAVTLLQNGAALAALRADRFSEVPDAWRSLAAAGIKVRPRALATTLFLRMFVTDLFIHGIGGAKYDEVTDRIIRAFYRVEPPAYAAVSATLMLPWPFDRARRADVATLNRRLRDIRYNPQYFLSEAAGGAGEVHDLIDEKHSLVDSAAPSHEARRRKWERIRALNGALSEYLRDDEGETRAALRETHDRFKSDEVLFGREYSVFLVGLEKAVSFYNEALRAVPAKSCPTG